MLLAVAATDLEMDPLKNELGLDKEVMYLVSGLGPVETALNVTRVVVGATDKNISGVVNFGVAGAFFDSGLDLLDICLADQEIFADFGICQGENVVPFNEEGGLRVRTGFPLDNSLLDRAEKVLGANNIVYRKGAFVTVNCSSGTARRGNYFRDKHKAICENMEGASVARVCEEFGLPCLEVRAVSNFVADRNEANWQLAKACRLSGRVTAILISGLLAQFSVHK